MIRKMHRPGPPFGIRDVKHPRLSHDGPLRADQVGFSVITAFVNHRFIPLFSDGTSTTSHSGTPDSGPYLIQCQRENQILGAWREPESFFI